MNNNQRAFTIFLTVITLLLAVFLTTRTPNDADMWWHLRSGQEMVTQGHILTSDVFSFTRFGSPWTNVFWLTDIGLYLIYQMGGFFGLTLVAAVTAAGIMAILLKHSRGPFPLRMGLVLLASFAISAFMNPRPQILSFLLLAVLDFGLARFKQNGNPAAWMLIPLFVLWANLHGGFFWGFLLLAAVIVGEGLNHLTDTENSLGWRKIGQLAGWGALGWLATAINPSGLALWKLPFYTVQVSLGTITEWGSPNFHRVDMQPMIWLIFLLIIGVGFAKKQLSWADTLKFSGFAYMAFISQRSIGPFVLVAVPVVSQYLALAWEERLKGVIAPAQANGYQRQAPNQSLGAAKVINLVIILLLATLAVGRAYWLSTPEKVYAELPQNAITWVKANHPEGRMFNSYNWGGYLMWTLPEYPVFIDGRADLYGDELLGAWWEVVNGSEKGLALLDKWQVKFVLLEPGWPVLQKLPTQGWQLLYKDNQAIIYGR
jgi:hypothetical protein